MNVTYMLCVDKTDPVYQSVALKGNYFTYEFRYLKMIYLPCTENPNVDYECGD